MAKRRNVHECGIESIRIKVTGSYHAGLIGIDGIDAVVQNLGNDFIMGNAEANESEDTQLSVLFVLSVVGSRSCLSRK